MAQGGAAAASPGWSWVGAGAGDDDWALTLLALAVVAATALALHWFGSRQDPEAAGPASAVPHAEPSQAGGAGPAPLPESEVSVGGQGRGSGQGGTGVARHMQAAAGAWGQASSGGLAAPAAPPLETPPEVACGGPLGQQHDHTPGAPPNKGREPMRAGSGKAGGTSAALLIHFTPRSPGREEEVQVKAGGLGAQVPVPRGLTGQDSSLWKQGLRPANSLGGGPGGTPQANHSSGHSAYRPPKPDHLRLGTVVSVWDAVDAASGLRAAPLKPTAQARPLGDGSERGLRKGSSPTAPVLALGSGADGGKSRETGPPAFRESRGSPGPVEGWPWARKEVLVTRSFGQDSDSTRSWPEARHWGHSRLSQGRGAREGGAVVSMGRGMAEEPGGHSTPEERGSGRGQGDPGSSQQPAGGAANLGLGRPPDRERPGSDPCQGPVSQSPPGLARPERPEYPQPLGSRPTAPPPSGAFPAAPTLPASSSDSPPSWVPTERRNLGAAPPTVQAAAPAQAGAPAPTRAPTLAPASGPRPASQGPRVALCKGDQGAQGSSSWGNLILMVLRSHPLPRQPPSQGRAPSVHAESPRGPSSFTSSGGRRPGVAPEGAVPSESAGGHPGAGTGSGAEAAAQPHQGSSEAEGVRTPGPSSGPRGEGAEEKRQDGPLRPAATPGAPSRAAKRESRPVRGRSPGEAEESAQGVHPAASERGPRERERERGPAAARGARSGPACLGAPLTEGQRREARRLMAFLQRPGSWGAVEGAGGPGARAAEPAAAAAAWRRRLDLGSCPDALAFARRHGEPGLARAACALLSAHLLRALRPPGPYRRLRGAERQRVLSLRSGRGPAVLGVLALPGPGPAGRPGLGRGPPRAQLHVLDPRGNAWRALAPVPEEAALRGCGLCTLHNYLFLAGGVRGAACSARVFCFDPLTGAWGQVRPMRQARAQPRLVALDGQLYAIGGECLRSVERYDPRADAWSARAPLPPGAFPVAREAAACRGDIYVAGGHLLGRLLRYSPERDAWDERPGGAGRRRPGDMVALGGCLYRFDLLRGVGAAVTRYNTVTGSWSRAAPLPLPRALPLRCAALGDTIYCLNRQVTATLVVCGATAQFQARELQPFPLGGKGVLCPFTLTLPAAAPPRPGA